ncbi:MAG: anthranilate synthase component I, partial [Thiolinea sp.]
MTPNEYQALVDQGYNRIPVARQVLADLDTPLTTYLKLAQGKYTYLFESVQGGEKWGRYSMIGLPASEVIKVYGHRIVREQAGERVAELEVKDPLAWISELQDSYRVPEIDGLP